MNQENEYIKWKESKSTFEFSKIDFETWWILITEEYLLMEDIPIKGVMEHAFEAGASFLRGNIAQDEYCEKEYEDGDPNGVLVEEKSHKLDNASKEEIIRKYLEKDSKTNELG